MKPTPFRYFAPTSLDEALSLLTVHAESAKLLAGGQSLVPLMNFRLARPEVIIDLNRVRELFYIRHDKNGLQIGAMTRQRQLERDAAVRERAPLLAEAMPYIAHPQIRNRGTLGGSLAHADPAAELPAVAVTLDTRLKLQSKRGERWVAAKDFFMGLFATALQPDEMLTEIHVPPMPARTGWSFQEVSRRHGDYALAGVAATLSLDDKGLCREARLVFLGMGGQPIMSERATRALVGQFPNDAEIRSVAESALNELDPSSDIHASADFRRQLAKTLAMRALKVAAGRAITTYQ